MPSVSIIVIFDDVMSSVFFYHPVVSPIIFLNELAIHTFLPTTSACAGDCEACRTEKQRQCAILYCLSHIYAAPIGL